MGRLLFILLFTLYVGGCTEDAGPLTTAEYRIVDRIRQIRELRHYAAACWPGFDAPQFDAPLLYYTDSVCYALNPDRCFRKAFAARLVHREKGLKIYKTALPDSLPFHMETQMNFEDSTAYNHRLPFLYCSSPEITRLTVADVTTDSLWLPMVLHEYAHGFQYMQPRFATVVAHALPSIAETELARYHKQYDWLDRSVRAENEELLAALDHTDTASRNACIRRFRSIRADRRERMAQKFGDSIVRDEIFYECMEGMARYIEAQVGFRLGAYSEADTWLFDTDHSGYFFATGYNLIRLLDRLGVDKSELYSNGIRPLDTFLKTTDDKN